MAAVGVGDDRVVVELSRLEQLVCLTRHRLFSISVADVYECGVLPRADLEAIDRHVDLGLALAGAPLAWAGICDLRSTSRTSGRAAVLTRPRRPALILQCSGSAPWQTLIVSVPTLGHAKQFQVSLAEARNPPER